MRAAQSPYLLGCGCGQPTHTTSPSPRPERQSFVVGEALNSFEVSKTPGVSETAVCSHAMHSALSRPSFTCIVAVIAVFCKLYFHCTVILSSCHQNPPSQHETRSADGARSSRESRLIKCLSRYHIMNLRLEQAIVVASSTPTPWLRHREPGIMPSDMETRIA